MKTWSQDHPKARIMARKRADILAASKTAFLATGYEATSMESIANAANVSIMTLYRHAKTKDELFSAVIANACDPGDETERAEMEDLLSKPFREVLVGAAMKAQGRLIDPDTVSLMRTVIAGAVKFPALAEIAYQGLIGGLVDMIDFVLGYKEEAAGVDRERRRSLSLQFIDRLVGADMLGVLMGFPAPSEQILRDRAEAATVELVRSIDQADVSLE